MVLLALSMLLTPVWSQLPGSASNLPALGDGSDITLSAERKLGDRIARELYRDPDYLEDPVLDEYLQNIWQPLVKGAQARGEMSAELQERFAWKILIGRDRSVNAFALPGGYLGIHLGLISVVTTRDELASVMAHELSHVTQRHISRSIGDQARMTPWLIGAMILGMLAASKSAQGAQAMIVGGQAMAAQSQLNFSRDMEREADRIGYSVMSEAGFDTQGFVTTLEDFASGAGMCGRYLAATGREVLGAEELMALAEAGNLEAQGILATSVRAVGMALTTAVDLLDPSAVIVGGGLGTSGGSWWERVSAEYRSGTAKRPGAPPLIEAALGSDAGAIGAALRSRM